MMNRLFNRRIVSALVFSSALATTALAADNPFVGGWALVLPGGGAGWLGVEESNGELQASLMWAAGSVTPLTSAKVEHGQLVLTRPHPVERKDADGKTIKTNVIETITGIAGGKLLRLTSTRPRDNGQGEQKLTFTGLRMPPLPPAPDLSKVKFGAPIQLFNGKDLSGWRLTDPRAISGWSAKDGILANTVEKVDGQPHKNYGNLRTDQEFEDFNLTLEARPGKGQNSGVYLRGIYEIQVADTYGKPLNSHNMGALYSRIKPTVAAEKPPGKWQTMDITFVDRHVTVILNGHRIIDNQPALGCTGGALWSDVMRPGPIYLQGDHTGIEYRNIVLRPVVK
jgi:hypothetical protein